MNKKVFCEFQPNVISNIEFPFGIIKIKYKYFDDNQKYYYAEYNNSIITDYSIDIEIVKNYSCKWVVEKAKQILKGVNDA